MNLDKNFFKENIKTIIYALLIAIFIRSIFFQPFYIPSSSMEPNLLVGDRLFVSKYSYGYSRHSFPFSPKISNKRYFFENPVRGDVIVFKTPADNRTDYIKRLIGIPGDKIQFISGLLYINNKPIKRTKKNISIKVNCGNKKHDTDVFEEVLPNGKRYIAVYNAKVALLNTDPYYVPLNHYFFLGDNRDCSSDSRYLSNVGYVNSLNLVGKAKILFFSSDREKGSMFNFLKWRNSIRFNRIFKIIR